MIADSPSSSLISPRKYICTFKLISRETPGAVRIVRRFLPLSFSLSPLPSSTLPRRVNFFPARIFFRMTRARYFAINYLPIYRDSSKQASPRGPGLRLFSHRVSISLFLFPSSTLALSLSLSRPLPPSPSLSSVLPDIIYLSRSHDYESITGYTRNSRTSPWNRPQHTLITDANGIIASIAGSYSLARSRARCSYETGYHRV